MRRDAFAGRSLTIHHRHRFQAWVMDQTVIERWEAAARRADELCDLMQTYVAAGRVVPHRLMEEVEAAQEDLSLQLLSLSRSERPGGLFH